MVSNFCVNLVHSRNSTLAKISCIEKFWPWSIIGGNDSLSSKILFHNAARTWSNCTRTISQYNNKLFHFAYTSCFACKKKAGSIIKEYVFVLAFSIIIHLLISLLLPVKGPPDLRLELFPEGTFFIPLVNFITKSYFQSGGTVSSLFVTIGVIIVAYVSKLFPKVHRLMILWLFLLLISTVICTFHYSVSAMAGMLTGLLFLAGGKKLYEKLL